MRNMDHVWEDVVSLEVISLRPYLFGVDLLSRNVDA